MKRVGKFLIIVTIILTTLVLSSVYATVAEVQINGEIIDFTDADGNKVNAQLINSRTMVPLRKIFEVLGCEIEWNGETKTVTANKNEKQIILQIDNPNATIIKAGIEETIKLDAAPVIVNNRTLVPLRFIAESLEKQVGWDSSSYTAIIIDYDYFTDLIKQKNIHLYEILNKTNQNTTFSITRNYIDMNDYALNSTAVLNGKVEKESELSKITLDFSGTDELMQEIITEGWNHIEYEAKYNANSIFIKTTNETFQKMLNIDAEEFTEFKIEELDLIGNADDSFSQAIESLFNIANSELTISTFKNMKTEFDTFLNLFVMNGNRNLNYQNAKMQDFDYTQFDNIVYGHELLRTLAFINQTIFHYDVVQNEFLYDWKNINYTLNCENNTLVLNLVLENDYNEKVEYIVECK